MGSQQMDQIGTFAACLKPLIEGETRFHSVRAFAARVLDAENNANIWFFNAKKDPEVSSRDLLHHLELAEEAFAECEEAMKSFAQVPDEEALRGSLGRIAVKLDWRPDAAMPGAGKSE